MLKFEQFQFTFASFQTCLSDHDANKQQKKKKKKKRTTHLPELDEKSPFSLRNDHYNRNHHRITPENSIKYL